MRFGKDLIFTVISFQGKLQINITLLDQEGSAPNFYYDLMDKFSSLLSINAGSSQTITLNGIHRPEVTLKINFTVSCSTPFSGLDCQIGKKIQIVMTANL